MSFEEWYQSVPRGDAILSADRRTLERIWQQRLHHLTYAEVREWLIKEARSERGSTGNLHFRPPVEDTLPLTGFSGDAVMRTSDYTVWVLDPRWLQLTVSEADRSDDHPPHLQDPREMLQEVRLLAQEMLQDPYIDRIRGRAERMVEILKWFKEPKTGWKPLP